MSIDPHKIRSCVYLMEESRFPFSTFRNCSKSFTDTNCKSINAVLCNKFFDLLRRGKILYPKIRGLTMFTISGPVITQTRRYVSNDVSIWGAIYRCINIHADGSFSTVRAGGYSNIAIGTFIYQNILCILSKYATINHTRKN